MSDHLTGPRGCGIVTYGDAYHVVHSAPTPVDHPMLQPPAIPADEAIATRIREALKTASALISEAQMMGITVDVSNVRSTDGDSLAVAITRRL